MLVSSGVVKDCVQWRGTGLCVVSSGEVKIVCSGVVKNTRIMA